MAKAHLWAVTDAEERKRGERTGLDTLVVHALNDAHSIFVPCGPDISAGLPCMSSLGKVLRVASN